MKYRFLNWFALSVVLALPVQAFEFKDGFEGPWVQPEGVFNPAFAGDGFDEDWYVDRVEWMGDNEFNLIAEEVIITEGEFSQAANAYWANGAPRDLFLARYVDTLEPGAAYRVSLDWRYDEGICPDFSHFIQIDVRDGDHRSRAGIADIENYGGHERPDTTVISGGDERIGSGEFNTFERIHIPEEPAITFLMIIRFCHLDESLGFAEPFDENWLYLDNFQVVSADTDVTDWSLY